MNLDDRGISFDCMTSQNKRENSVSLGDLQVLSERIKRCAISVDGTVQVQRGHSNTNMSVQVPQEDNNIIHVMSTSKSNFSDIYQLLGEIGRGGFSTVFRCKQLVTQQIYAVKVTLLLFCFTCIINLVILINRW